MDILTAPIIGIVLAVAGTVWWFKTSIEKLTEKIYGMEQELKNHTNEERVQNATSKLEYDSLKENLLRIESKLMQGDRYDLGD